RDAGPPGGRDAPVLLVRDRGDAVRPGLAAALDRAGRVVGAAVVDEHELGPDAGLVGRGEEALGEREDVPFLVQARDDDGEAGPASQRQIRPRPAASGVPACQPRPRRASPGSPARTVPAVQSAGPASGSSSEPAVSSRSRVTSFTVTARPVETLYVAPSCAR